MWIYKKSWTHFSLENIRLWVCVVFKNHRCCVVRMDYLKNIFNTCYNYVLHTTTLTTSQQKNISLVQLDRNQLHSKVFFIKFVCNLYIRRETFPTNVKVYNNEWCVILVNNIAYVCKIIWFTFNTITRFSCMRTYCNNK